ncbi:NAD(P)/FAD-dependent oxidoreductase [Streptomyces stramineus]|uniref:FAD dependent oxidoreductase domain-containing protein n=1 Tax=Streptomyces stramineus TaxID=173861 RepID=A0ABN1A4C7_9ACTN
MRSLADVIVVGNGALGLSVAVEIARRAPELKVSVIGPAERARAASVAAGAMLNCFGEVTTYTGRHPVSAARFAVAREALDLWPQWLAALEEDVGGANFRAVRASWSEGTFVIMSSSSGRIAGENFAAMCAAAEEHGEPHELVAPEEVAGLSPRLGHRPLRVLHLRREGAVDGRAMVAALEQAARERRVELVPATVRALLRPSGGAVSGVELQDGRTVSAGAVVLAAGVASGALAGQVLPPGAVPPMLHGTGLAVTVKRANTGPRGPHVIRTPNRAGTCGLHVVPLAGEDEQYIGATNVITFDPAPGVYLGLAQTMMRQASEQVDEALAVSYVHRWMIGTRPIPLDCYPLIGACSIPGLLFATGTYRDGFHSSPAIARHLAALLLQDTAAEKDTPFTHFAPERMPIQTMSVPEAVDDTARHAADTMHDQGTRMPWWLDSTPLEEWARARIRTFYESLEDPVALPPEVVDPQFLDPTAIETRSVDLLRRYLRAARAHHGT